MRKFYSWVAVMLLAVALPSTMQARTLYSGRNEGGNANQDPRASTPSNHGLADTLLNKLRSIRDGQIRSGALDSALRTGLRITEINGTSNDRVAMANDWEVMAKIGHESGDLGQAIACSKKAVLILKTTGNHSMVATSTLHLLDFLLEGGRFSEFKHVSEDALAASKRDGDKAGQARLLFRQGECLNQQGRAVDALPLLHSALRESPTDMNDREAACIRFALARAYAGVAQWEAARAAFDDACNRLPGVPRSMPGLYALNATIYEGLGDLPNALKYERLRTATKDSLLDVARAERLANIQTMYEVGAKDKELTQLKETQGALQVALASGQSDLKMLLLALSVLGLSLLVLILLRVRHSYMVRRTRIRGKVIAGQAQVLQAKSLELERQNLRLSHALMLDDLKNRTPGQDEMKWVELLLNTQARHTTDQVVAQALNDFHDRIRTLSLLNSNMAKQVGPDKLNLKAHLATMAAAMMEKYGMASQITAEITLPENTLATEDLLALSLLLNELLLLTCSKVETMGCEARIRVTLRQLGRQQCELQYTDEVGGISKATIGNGGMSGELVQAIVRSMGGSLLLLKGEHTTLQVTFDPDRHAALRKAS